MSDLDQTSVLCETFYRTFAPRTDGVYVPGQLVLAHVTYSEVEPYILDVTGFDPKDPKNSTFTGRRLTPKTETKTHFPLKELQLQADEFYYIVRGKFRPAIVVQSVATDWGNRLHPQPYVLVAPGFTLNKRHDERYQYRVVSFEFPHLFFLPKQAHGFHEDTILRFEHLQAIPLGGIRPAFDGTQWCALSDEAFLLFRHQLAKFMHDRVFDADTEDTIVGYRQLVRETFLG